MDRKISPLPLRLKTLSGLLAVSVSILASLTCTGQIVTAKEKPASEEQIVRSAYAKLIFSVEVGAIYDIFQESNDPFKIDRVDFFHQLANKKLSILLTDFKTGAIEDIKGTRYQDLVSKPTGEILTGSNDQFIHTETRNGHAEKTISNFVHLSWGPGQDVSGEDWDVPFGSIQELISVQNDKAVFTRYATYSIVLTYQNKGRVYHAMFLFGKGADGTPRILPVDTVMNLQGSALANSMKMSNRELYPEALLQIAGREKNPVLLEWLNREKMPGPSHEVVCDLKDLKCGISEQDVDRFLSYLFRPRMVDAAFHLSSAGYACLDDACTPRNFSDGPTSSQTPIDTTSHVFGGHWLSDIKRKSCTYREGNSSNGSCDVKCSAQVTGAANENGLASGFAHATQIANKGGDADGIGTGASCTGASGLGVKACFLAACAVSVSVDVLGSKVTVTSDGFYSVEDDTTVNCGEQKPVTSTAGGGVGTGGGVCGNGTGNTGGPTALGDGSGSDVGTTCGPGAGSPIIIDTEGEGFHLTSAADGVKFDIRGDGLPVQMAWTERGSHNAFLALDRNGDGKISSGKDLFGNFTSQPPSDHPNGFLALKEFDNPENGGNGDNFIDERDEVFAKLRLWIDENHDGIAQSNELHRLPELGVYAISLDYEESRRHDRFGNQFRYKGKVNPSGWRRDERDERSEAGRWTYDVFFVIGK